MDNPLFKKYLTKAMAFCSRAEYCIDDIKRKMQLWKVPDELHNEIIDLLIDDNFISHKRYAESFARGKMRYNHWGKIKIKYMLKAKHIEQQYIDEAINMLKDKEYNEIVQSQIITKNKGIKETENLKRKAKLMNFAASRGYETDLALKFINQILTKE